MKRFLVTPLALGFCLIAPSVAIAEKADTSKTLEQLLTFPLLPMLLGIGGAIACILLAIYTKHKQKMSVVKMEITPEEKLYKRERLLIGGITIAAIGAVLLIIGLFIKFLPIPDLQLEKSIIRPTSSVLLAQSIIRLISLVFLALGLALVGSYYLLKREEKVMKAVLHELNELKKKGRKIKVNNNDELKGDIDRISDDELLVLKAGEDPDTYNIYIPINKITSLEQIPE